MSEHKALVKGENQNLLQGTHTHKLHVQKVCLTYKIHFKIVQIQQTINE